MATKTFFYNDELNLGGTIVTSTAAELNILDGVTSTATELNLVDGSTAGNIVNGKAVVYGSSGEVNATTLQIGGTAITSTAAELNILDGVTSTAAELNILDGISSFNQGTLASTDNTIPSEATVKNYVDSVASGLDVKASCKLATTASKTLSTDFANGESIDGITLATNDRILIKNQTSASENGIYTVNASGAPTRATDFDAASDVSSGAFTFITHGTANANKGFVLTTTDPITPGTTALTFSQFSAAASISNDSVNGDKLTDNITIADSLTVTNKLIITPDTPTISADDTTYEFTSGIMYFTFSHSANATLTVDSDNSTSGQIVHIFFKQGGTKSLIFNFGTNKLHTGSGTATSLTFGSTGQSATIIYLGGTDKIWGIINSGATVA